MTENSGACGVAQFQVFSYSQHGQREEHIQLRAPGHTAAKEVR